jgi:hypothetical protein
VNEETYECAVCHRTRTKGRSDEEALAEHDALFERDGSPLVPVCDDCWVNVMAWVLETQPGILKPAPGEL